MKLLHLTTLDDSISANLLKTKLESEGIMCILNNENFTNLMPHYFNILGSGVRIMVLEEDYQKAREITQIPESKLICPNCHSENIKNKVENGVYKTLLIIITLIFTGLIGNLLNRYTCNNYAHEFKG